MSAQKAASKKEVVAQASKRTRSAGNIIRQISSEELPEHDIKALHGLLGQAYSHGKPDSHFIDNPPTGNADAESITGRLQQLDAQLPASASGERASEMVRRLFPELALAELAEQQATLPSTAPKHWQTDRLADETAPDFVRRVYGEWIGKGLTKADIRRVDIRLYEAIHRWCQKQPWPDDLTLPTLKERNDAHAAALVASATPGQLPAAYRAAGHLSHLRYSRPSPAEKRHR